MSREPRLAPVVNIEDLATTCWCEAHVVHVPRRTILAGLTISCGRRGCQRPA